MGQIVQGHKRRVVRVTPTLSTDAYADNDVFLPQQKFLMQFLVKEIAQN